MGSLHISVFCLIPCPVRVQRQGYWEGPHIQGLDSAIDLLWVIQICLTLVDHLNKYRGQLGSPMPKWYENECLIPITKGIDGLFTICYI